MSAPKKVVIRFPEPLGLSIARDLVSTGTLLGAIGVGVWLDSDALQWVAGIIWCLWLIGKGTELTEKRTHTVAEARKLLDEYEHLPPDSDSGREG